jgi:hypothetical protein
MKGNEMKASRRKKLKETEMWKLMWERENYSIIVCVYSIQ